MIRLRLPILAFAVFGLFISVWPASSRSAPAPDKSGVGPNAVTLPTGPGSISGFGATYDWSIDANKGSYRYTARLRTPSGPAGQDPGVEIGYGSDFAAGPLGQGWRLSLPYIEQDTGDRLPVPYDLSHILAALVVVEEEEEETFRTDHGERLRRADDGYYYAEYERRFIRYRRMERGWRAYLPDGGRIDFGTSAASRLESRDGKRVFRWLPERQIDAHGNEIRFYYRAAKLERVSDAVPQRLIERIEYGPGPPPWAVKHIVFFRYGVRPDRLLDGRPGFLVELGERLVAIDIAVAGVRAVPDVTVLPDFVVGDAIQLIRSYRLRYKPVSRLNGISLLGSISEIGRDGQTALPPVTFSYATGTAAEGLNPAAPGVRAVELDGNLSLSAPRVEIVDVNADALPDLVVTSGTGNRPIEAVLNLGSPHSGDTPVFSRLIAMSGDPLSRDVALASTGADAGFADFNGDGRADLSYRSSSDRIYFFPNEGNTSWGQRRELGAGGALPSRFSGRTDVRQADLDGDRRIDLVQSFDRGRYLRVWYCLAEGRYSSPVIWRCDNGCDFSNGVQLADVTGDQRTDLVRLTPSRVEYQPGTGFGAFGDARSLPMPSGSITRRDLAAARLVDVTGDGLSDLVIGPDSSGLLRLSVNHGGSALGDWVRFVGAPRAGDRKAKLRWGDMNGDGATDLVRLHDGRARPTVEIFNFLAALKTPGKPNLLTEVDNGRGLRVRITYRTAAEQAAEARAEGRAWTTTSPIAASVVSEVSVSTYPQPVPSVRRYRYFDGIYSDEERKYHGFETVEMEEVGLPVEENGSGRATAHPGLITRTQFDRGDVWPSRRGAVLREQQLSLDRRPLVDRRTQWNEPPKALRVREGTAVSVFSHPVGEFTRLTDETGGPDVFLSQRTAYDSYGNRIRLQELGEVDAAGKPRSPESIRVTETDFIVDDARWLLHSPRAVRLFNSAGILLSETRHHYDDETFDPRAGEALERGLPTMIRVRRAPETGTGDQLPEWLVQERLRYDSFGNLVLSLGPLAQLDDDGMPATEAGHFVSFDIDPLFRSRVLRENVGVDADTTLVHHFAYDSGFGSVTSHTDASGTETRYEYDPLGRLKAIHTAMDAPSRPSTRFVYGAGEPTSDGGAISWIDTLLLNAPAEPSDEKAYLRSRRYLDGAGRAVYTVGPGSGGINGDALATVVGVARFSGRGSLIQSLNPCVAPPREDPLSWSNPFAPDWACDWLIDGAWQRHTLATSPGTLRRYDALDREIEIIAPDGAVRRIHHRPLERRLEDENVTAGAAGAAFVIRSDGHGRTVEMMETPRLADDGSRTTDRRDWSTRFGYDARDLLVSIRDAAGRNRYARYDGLGRVARIDSPDFGALILTYDDASNLIEQVDASGRKHRFTYDGADRLIASRATAAHGEPISTRYVYDVHRLGRLSRIDDAFGTEELFYDDRGRVTEVRRTVAEAFGGNTYGVVSVYDSMDRLTSKTFPDGDRLTLAYGDRGLLTGAAMTSVGDILLDSLYSPDEQPIAVRYANGLNRRFAYDVRARLTRSEVLSDGQALPLFSEVLVHDPASNIVGRERLVAGRRTAETFGYDDLHRLVAAHRTDSNGDAKAWTYRYDRIGNLLEATFNNGPVDIDVNRDVTGRVVQTGDLVIGWNAEGRVASARGRGLELSNVYDYEGRRVLRRLARLAEPENDERLLSLFSDYELRDERRVKFLKLFGGLAATVENASTAAASTVHYHHTDHLGSSIIRFDDAGAIVGETAIAPFGALDKTKGVGSFGRGFTGVHQDAALGIVQFEARAMMSSSGRFLSPDPALIAIDAPPASPQALNPFSYSVNRPLTHKDPDGQLFSLVVTAGFAGYDTYQYLVGNMSGGEYAAAMALNGAALIADVATAGAGGGLAVRAGNLGVRTAKGVTRADTIYSSMNAAVHASKEVRDGNYGRALLMGAVAAVGAKGAVKSKNIRRVETIGFPSKQLQKKFKHAEDFGVKGNYNKINRERFMKNIKNHISNPSTKKLEGTFRGDKVTHYYNPRTNLNVMKKGGQFHSGWKLNTKQIERILKDGSLGGG